MSQNTFSVGAALNRGWAAFSSQMGLLIGGGVLFMLINIVGGMVPYVGMIYSLVLSPVIVGGWMTLVMNVVSGRQAAVGDLFSGFNRFGQWLGAYWLWIGIAFLAALPAGIVAGIGIGIGAAVGEGDAQTAIFIFTGLFAIVIFLVAIIEVSLIWGLNQYIIADYWNEGGIIIAFKKSAAITKGYRGTLFLGFLLTSLIAMAGVLACFIGTIFTIPLATCMFAAMYKQLREIYEPQPAAVAAGPVAFGAGPAAFVPLAQPAPSEAKNWFFGVGGKSFGPYTASELADLYKSGNFGAQDYVYCEGQTQGWVSPAQVAFLSAGQASADEGPINLA
jgi:hypothetical protein